MATRKSASRISAPAPTASGEVARKDEVDAKVTNVSGLTGAWLGTTANLPATGTTGVIYFTTD